MSVHVQTFTGSVRSGSLSPMEFAITQTMNQRSVTECLLPLGPPRIATARSVTSVVQTTAARGALGPFPSPADHRNEEDRQVCLFEGGADDRRAPGSQLLRPAERNDVGVDLACDGDDVLVRSPRRGSRVGRPRADRASSVSGTRGPSWPSRAVADP